MLLSKETYNRRNQNQLKRNNMPQICKKWDPDATERTMVVWQDIYLKRQGEWGVNQSKHRGRADNTIRAGRMTTESVWVGSGLERGGGSSRGRARQEDRDPVAWSESQKLHQPCHQAGTHRTRDLTCESGALLPGSRGQRPGNLSKGQDRAKHDKQDETQNNTKPHKCKQNKSKNNNQN